jgi:hypothetical protein
VAAAAQFAFVTRARIFRAANTRRHFRAGPSLIMPVARVPSSTSTCWPSRYPTMFCSRELIVHREGSGCNVEHE